MLSEAVKYVNAAFELVVLIEAAAIYLLYKRLSILEQHSRNFATHEHVDKRITEKLEVIIQMLNHIKEKLDDRS